MFDSLLRSEQRECAGHYRRGSWPVCGRKVARKVLPAARRSRARPKAPIGLCMCVYVMVLSAARGKEARSWPESLHTAIVDRPTHVLVHMCFSYVNFHLLMRPALCVVDPRSEASSCADASYDNDDIEPNRGQPVASASLTRCLVSRVYVIVPLCRHRRS